ncbi:MAG: RagB/SusD family nutrient uptake outer membrane protein, partial [Bacteroidales bacterium]|nr:RagB/SusD family nutrient uptake outer membrane protein [Bacteroidales bacterium]
MKKFHIIMSIAAAFCAVSCDGFLTKLPETQLSPETFFRTENELELFTNGFYASVLPSPTSCAEQVADDHFSSSLSAIQKGTRLPSSKSWAGIFDTLRDVNYFLEKNVNCDEATREKYNGVAYFFRAMIYFEMVRQFGDMPYYDKVLGSTDTKELTKPRDPRGYVMMKVLEDCDRAYERLPEDWGSDSQYRLSKDAALALKSRAALFEGTFRKYHAGTEYLPVDEQVFDGVTVSSEWFLRQAADAAALMIGSRSLYNGNEMKLDPKRSTPYREYFLLEDAEKNETILARRYAVDLAIRH